MKAEGQCLWTLHQPQEQPSSGQERESCGPSVIAQSWPRDYKESPVERWNQSHTESGWDFILRIMDWGWSDPSALWRLMRGRKPHKPGAPLGGSWNKQGKWPWLLSQDAERAGYKHINERHIKMAELLVLCDQKQEVIENKKSMVLGILQGHGASHWVRQARRVRSVHQVRPAASGWKVQVWVGGHAQDSSHGWLPRETEQRHSSIS